MIPRIRQFIAGRRRVFVVLAIILVAVFVLSRVVNRPSSPLYQTATATRGTLVSSVTAAGTVVATNNINVTTTASGQVSQVFVSEGTQVKKGQKLLEITLDAEGEQRQAQAYASLLSAQNSLNSAKANYYNLQAAAFKANQTFINDAVARNLPTDDPTYIQENDAWLAAELNFNNAQDSIKSAQANLTNATIAYNQASSTVTAPLSGVVRNITVVPGMSVGGSNSSTILASIQTPGNPVATVNIAEVDVSKVKPGQKVTLTFDSIPDVTFTGKVAGINKLGVVSSGVTSYPATIQFDSTSDKILPNMAVQAAIITDVKEDVILVPSSSVTSSNGQTVVRTLRNGQLVAVPVTVGERSDSQTEIIDGVSEGEVVVTAIPNQNSRTNSSNNSSPFGGARGFGSFGGGGGNVRVFTR